MPATCPYPEPDQSSPCHPTSWRFILILSSHLRFGLPSGLFPSGFPIKTLYTPLLSPIRASWFVTVVTKVFHWNLSLSTSTSRIRFSYHFCIITHLLTIRKWHLFKSLNTSFSPVRLNCPTSFNLTGLIVTTIHEWLLAGQPTFACWQSFHISTIPNWILGPCTLLCWKHAYIPEDTSLGVRTPHAFRTVPY